MLLDCAPVGPPPMTLDQMERFFRKGLAMVEDARKEVE